jgi:hypothetical protein
VWIAYRLTSRAADCATRVPAAIARRPESSPDVRGDRVLREMHFARRMREVVMRAPPS